MRIISDLHELNIPSKHQKFIVNTVRKRVTCPKSIKSTISGYSSESTYAIALPARFTQIKKRFDSTEIRSKIKFCVWRGRLSS